MRPRHVESYRPPTTPYVDPWRETWHREGWPVPSERARKDGRDVTTLPVSEWSAYDQRRYALGWRPDRFGDDPATIPEKER